MAIQGHQQRRHGCRSNLSSAVSAAIVVAYSALEDESYGAETLLDQIADEENGA